MRYEAGQFLFPPRPETKIPRTMLGFYERRGFIAQKKKNGTCTVVFARGDQVTFKTRHNEAHKLWTPKPHHLAAFQGHENWCVFVGELLHSKVAGGPKDELYLFDLIAYDGVQLIGTSFSERQDMLRRLFPTQVDEGDQFRVAPGVSVARNFERGFDSLFNNLKKEDEGLVLKDPRSKLKSCLQQSANAGWQVKSRITHSSYSF